MEKAFTGALLLSLFLIYLGLNPVLALAGLVGLTWMIGKGW